MAKDFKLMGEAYTRIYEALPQGVAGAPGVMLPSTAPKAAAPAPAPVTDAGVVGATSDTASSDQAKTSFDTAATAYFKAMGVDDTNIKKFLDSTHAQLNGFKGKGGANLGGNTGTSQYLPKTSTPVSTPAPAAASAPAQQFATGRGLTSPQRPSWASK